jgi:hypothetical protein
MRHYLSSALTAFALTTSLAACGGSSSLSVNDAFTEAANAGCTKAFECMASYPTGGTPFASQYGASVSECEMKNSALITAVVASYNASITAGRISYNGTDAQSCLDATKGETCPQYWGTDTTFVEPASCKTAFKGTVADGGTCTIDQDCAATGSGCNTAKVCSPA